MAAPVGNKPRRPVVDGQAPSTTPDSPDGGQNRLRQSAKPIRPVDTFLGLCRVKGLELCAHVDVPTLT